MLEYAQGLIISTHAPTEGSDDNQTRLIKSRHVFQPTLPPKGATERLIFSNTKTTKFQPTLPPKGATSVAHLIHPSNVLFQPTLPPKGATRRGSLRGCDGDDFNPRSHRRERRGQIVAQQRRRGISTHAPTEGSDSSRHYWTVAAYYFNPRSHRRERRQSSQFSFSLSHLFQPTLPPKGATMSPGSGS